ncbi:Cytochrome P450 [Quadrisphaera granulorum]|uniref:Cytochrome P450 n=1 Tax=Quadrisphaera granulorum TaxID=317664 RepID=A0A316AB91_9ACTN|nr:cytochrome P450 [Quadrisphaera granulorum]PWJ54901.1 cytochrome P450 [Quadrisphaera granulorum]SZE95847.1 Cytochrome P450 [Quadrisphaera granulorum]
MPPPVPPDLPKDEAQQARTPRPNARYTVLDAPGPLPRDMLRDLLAIRRDPLEYLRSAAGRWGDHIAFPLPRSPVLFVNTVAGARRVLVENAGAWSKRTVQYGALSLVTGSGLLTSDGSAWREARRVAQPAFHRSGLVAVAEQSVAAAERLRARWDATASEGVVDVDAAALQATLEVVGRTLFGGDVTAESAGDGERVVAAVLEALGVVISRARTPVPGWLPTPSRARLRRANRVMDEVVERVVARRRASDELGDDLLGLLLAAVDEGRLPPEAVRGELVTMVIAGHETVASCLTWTLHLLAEHPEAQRRLHAELDAVLETHEDDDGALRAPSWEDLRALTWTRAVVDESLRLYPPAWVVTRRADADDVVDGVVVPAGTLVIVSPWLLQRRADAHPDPETFDPARFTGEGPAVPRGAYLPFGAGARLCIGRDFALTEAVLVLAALLRDREVRPAPGPAPVVEALVTLRPRHGLPLRLVPRSPTER